MYLCNIVIVVSNLLTNPSEDSSFVTETYFHVLASNVTNNS
jgi:hypothetical protein